MKKWLYRCIVRDENYPLTVHSYISWRKNKIYKNLILLSLSQSCMYVMYKLIMMIREYEHDFLGIWSYAVLNVAKIFGFLLLPTFVLSRLRLQNSLRYGMLLSSLLIFILYVKSIEAVIPIAMLVGLIASTTWVSQQLYVYRLAKIMSKISGDDLEMILLRFSGIFFSIYRSYEIACYLPISFVPSPHKASNNSKDHCGTKFHFADYDSLSGFTLPPRNERSFVASVIVMVLAFCTLLLSIAFIDPPQKLTATHLGREEYPFGFATTIRLFKRRKLQLMIPMSLFAGYEKIIKSYDYTTAYVGCTESFPRAIYVDFLGCLAASQLSLSLAPLVELTSLQIVFSIAASTHLILILVLLLKSHFGLIGYYVMSAMWGLASSTWDCLLYVLYGMLSPGEELEAYCHLGFWCSMGACVNLFLTRLVSVSLKLWTALLILAIAAASVSMLPYIINYVPKKVGPTDATAGRRRTSGFARQGVNDTSRKVGVYFGKTGEPRKYYPPEVKSITTSKIHHVAIPKTRPRFEDAKVQLSLSHSWRLHFTSQLQGLLFPSVRSRHDRSSEDIETSV